MEEKEKLFAFILEGNINSFFTVCQKINFIDAIEGSPDHDFVSNSPKIHLPNDKECQNESKQVISRESQLQCIYNKNQAFDIFQNAMCDNHPIYEP